MKLSIAFLAGTWLSTTVWTAFSTDTSIVHLIKSIPNSVICPEIICPEESFVRRDDAGNCGCSTTGSCDFIKCAWGPPIQNPVTGHCLCPLPHPIIILPQPNCVGVACPLGGTAHYNTTLDSCACPPPPCLAKCYDGYRTGFDSTTGACTCIKEPLCPHDRVLCLSGLSYGFSEVTLTCGCFPEAAQISPNSPPHQASLKACGILCKDGFRPDGARCRCVPIKPCSIQCKDGYKLDTESCTCIPIKPCPIQCKTGTKLDTDTCTCIPIKPCPIQCKAGTKLDTDTCTCVPIKPCSIRCKDGFKLDTETCTCVPIKPCDIQCKTGTKLDTDTCTCVPIRPCDIQCKTGTKLDTDTCTCVPIRPCDIFCKDGFRLDTAVCTCIPNNPAASPTPGSSSKPPSLPTPTGNCATFAPCPEGQFAGFAPFTLECGCMNCDALHCPDNRQPQFDPASQKCYCDGVPGECFDLECPPPGQQLVFQQVQNPDGTVDETCACKSTL